MADRPLNQSQRDYLGAFDAWLADGGLDGEASARVVLRKQAAFDRMVGGVQLGGSANTGRVSECAPVGRTCAYCDCQLSRYNPDGYCAPCAPRVAEEEERQEYERTARAERERFARRRERATERADAADAFSFLERIRETD